MARVGVGLLWTAWLAVAGAPAAAAQTPQEGWQVSVDFLFITTRGNDVHVGDVFTATERQSGTLADSRFDYGVTYDEIVTRMKADQNVLVSAAYRGPQWGFGARGWSVSTNGDAEGRDSTPVSASTFAITGIRLWDHSLIPVPNLQHPSGTSPVTFDARNDLTNIRVEGYAERRWIAGSELNLATRFGVAHARVENTREEGQTMAAFLVDTQGATTTTFVNDIVIRSESEATASLTGPMVALAGDSTFRRVRLEWLVSQSLLMGTAETSGEWIDIDDISETIVTGGVTTVEFELLHGSIPVARDRRVAVPTLDFQLKASVQATRQVSVGAGFLSSTWFRLPAAPAFSVPGVWYDLDGTGWRDQTRDVTFNAVSVFAAFGF